MSKLVFQFGGERMVYLINGAGTTGYPSGRNQKRTPSHYIKKN